MTQKFASREGRPAVRDGRRIVYEWFAGWRWEHYQHGTLLDESLQSFQTEQECIADADRHEPGPALRRAA